MVQTFTHIGLIDLYNNNKIMIGTIIYLGGGILSYKVMFLVLVFLEPYTLKHIPAISFMQYKYIISEPEITVQSCPGRVPDKF